MDTTLGTQKRLREMVEILNQVEPRFGSALIALDLSRFCAAPSVRLGHLAFESHGAFLAEG